MTGPRHPPDRRPGGEEATPPRRVGPRHPTAGSSPMLPAVRSDWPHLRLRRSREEPGADPVSADPASGGDAPPGGSGSADARSLPDERPDTSRRLFRSAPPRAEAGGRRRAAGTRMALASMLRQRRRIALSTAIVALGVAYLAGALSLLHRVSEGLDDLAGTGTEPADLVLEGRISFDSPLEQVRSLIPDDLVGQVESVAGVEAAEARVESTAVIVGPDGEPVVPLGITQRPAGANWPEVDALNPYRFVGPGEPPTGRDEVVIDSTTAASGDLAVGDRVGVLTNATYGTFTVTGVVDLDGTDLPPGSSLALFGLDRARELFDQVDDNAIAVQLEDGADPGEVAAGIELRAGPQVEVSTPAAYEEHRRTSLAKSFTLVRALLLGFAGLAVVVGAFTVANSNALLFARRRHGFALLRLAGAERRQLLGAATVEAGLVGVAAAVAGVPLGLAAGALIEQALGALGAPVPTAGSSFPVAMVGIAAAVGIGVTVLTALPAARDAASVAPVTALTRDDDPAGRRGAGFLARLGLAAAGGAALGAALAATISAEPTAVAVGAAVGALAIGGFTLIPPVLGRLVGAATRLLMGSSAALRSLTALRSRRARTRAASTTAALLLATGVVATLATLSSSFVASLTGEVDRVVAADLVVDSGTFTRGGLPSDLIDELQETDGVEAASGVRLGRGTADGLGARFSALDGAAVGQVVDLGLDVPGGRLDDDEVLFSAAFAERLGVAAGDTVVLDFSSTLLTAEVAGVFPDTSALLGDGIITTNLLDQSVPTSVDILALVDLDTDDPDAAERVQEVAASYGVSDVLPPGELVDQRAELVRGFQRVIEWMLLFSVALAVIGVANTLQLSVNERRRELGLLRAVGASRRQVVRLVVVEAGALSVVGAALGIVIGVGLAFGTVVALSSFGLDRLELPTATLAGTALAAVALGILGALLPAWRASGTGVVEALGEDAERTSTVLGRFSRFRAGRRSRSLTTTAPASPRVPRATGPAPDEPRAVEDEPTTGPEEHMATRCYNCGNDPGPGDRCEVCDASQIPEPMGMFSTAPTAGGAGPTRRVAAATRAPTVEREDRGNGTWSRDEPGERTSGDDAERRFADIVDAAIVDEEDDDLGPDGHEHRTGPVGATRTTAGAAPTTNARPDAPSPDPERDAPPTRRATSGFATGPREEPGPAGEWTAEPEPSHGTPLGSIFEEPEPPAAQPRRTGTRSPFGQHANDEQPAEPEWGTPERTADGATTQTPPPPPQQQQPPPPQPPYVPPPSYPRPSQGYASAPGGYGYPAAPPVDPFAQAGVGAPGPGGTTVTPDQQGLAAAIAKLSPQAQQQGTVAFCVAGGLLGPEEVVLGAIQGWSLGMPTVAVLTNVRVLLISERRWKPVVEVFPLRPGLTIFGRHVDHQASVTLQEGDRVITLDQVADVTAAVELATTARARSTGTGF